LPASNSQKTSSRASEFGNGILDELPLQIGVFPFGLVFGIAGLAAGLTPLQVCALSFILFGGASQIVFAQMVGAAAPFAVLTGSVAAINLRHLLYGVAIVNYLRHLPISWRIVLGYLLTDEAWAISMRRFRSQPASPVMHYHLLGAGVTLWVCWQVSTLAGVLLGATIPEELQLGFAVPLTFIALIVPALKKRAEILAALSAGLAALLLQDLPFNLWLIASALIGIGVGMGAGQFEEPRADR